MAAPTKSGDVATHPPVLEWAQRKDRVWITVILENCASPTYEIKKNTFYFKGKGGIDNLEHEVTLELFAEIIPEKSTCNTKDRHAVFILVKKDQDVSYWPRLTKDKTKFHFIKTDFNRWKDEDDSEEDEKEDFNLDQMMNSMGGLKSADFGGGMAAEDQRDSDDEDLPDLQ